MTHPETVLVTGGNGHLGYHLCKTLIELGYRVRASVRDLKDPMKVSHLKPLGVELVQADLMDFPSLASAMKSVSGVFHSAAPNLPWSRNPEGEILHPIREGTLNVFRAAQAEGVRRMVFTSSCSAIGMDAAEGSPLTEDQWYLDAVTPLIRAKIEAEMLATRFAKAHDMTMLSICMPSMIGPGFFRHTPNTQMYERAILGRLPPLPRLGFHLVDARDAALAHALAYGNPKASGRYIVAGQYFESVDLIHFLKKIDSNLKLSTRSLPGWFLPGVCALDWVKNKTTGAPREVTRGMVREFVGKFQRVSASRAERELGWRARPAEETVRDTLAWIRKYYLKSKIER